MAFVWLLLLCGVTTGTIVINVDFQTSSQFHSLTKLLEEPKVTFWQEPRVIRQRNGVLDFCLSRSCGCNLFGVCVCVCERECEGGGVLCVVRGAA